MHLRLLTIVTVLLAATTPAQAQRAPQTVFTVSAGYNYSWGDYGQLNETRVTYAPLTLKWQRGEWSAKLLMPYIRITGPGVVVGDVPVGTPRPVGTEEGLGDITPSLTWTHTLNRFGTTAELSGILKLPTADEDKRLGTGLTDFTAQAGLIQPIGKAYLNGNIGRKFNGANATFPLRDVWKYTVGGGYRLFDQTSIGLLYDYRERQSTGSENLSLLTGYVSQSITPQWSVQLYASKGYSNSSPDANLGLQINRSFDLF
ncbi:MAG TPA: hypothetical protein VEF76_08625 [Patescibacteria group bacterium]|nr:hypothetical protein [Patescibacteria group bacterium]